MLTERDIADLGSVRASMEDVRTRLHTAQARLDCGHPVDLAGMDVTMGAVCTQALTLPPPLARQTLPDLMALRDAVESLINALAAGPPR